MCRHWAYSIFDQFGTKTLCYLKRFLVLQSLAVNFTGTAGRTSISNLCQFGGIFIIEVTFKKGSGDVHFTHSRIGKKPELTKGRTNFRVFSTLYIPPPVILAPVAACASPDLIFIIVQGFFEKLLFHN